MIVKCKRCGKSRILRKWDKPGKTGLCRQCSTTINGRSTALSNGTERIRSHRRDGKEWKQVVIRVNGKWIPKARYVLGILKNRSVRVVYLDGDSTNCSLNNLTTAGTKQYECCLLCDKLIRSTRKKNHVCRSCRNKIRHQEMNMPGHMVIIALYLERGMKDELEKLAEASRRACEEWSKTNVRPCESVDEDQ